MFWLSSRVLDLLVRFFENGVTAESESALSAYTAHTTNTFCFMYGPHGSVPVHYVGRMYQ